MKTNQETTIDDGGAAFPQMLHSAYTGMSLRDWFAGMALQGILSTESFIDAVRALPSGAATAQAVSASYRAADAMLAARKGEVK